MHPSRRKSGFLHGEQVGHFYRDERYARLACLGFDNKLRDIADPEGFGAALATHGARVLVLKRRNVVKQVTSGLNALRTRTITGRVHAYEAQDIPHEPFTLDLQQFDAHLRRPVHRLEALDRFARSRDWPALEVLYEDLVLEREATIQRIVAFLDAPQGSIQLEPRGKPLKQSPTELQQLLTNFEALRQRYAGTPWRDMIEDPGL